MDVCRGFHYFIIFLEYWKFNTPKNSINDAPNFFCFFPYSTLTPPSRGRQLAALKVVAGRYRPQDGWIGPGKTGQTQGSIQTLQSAQSWLSDARVAQGTLKPARSQPNPRFWVVIWSATSSTPLAAGLWMEGLGWSMIQKKFFSSGVYRVLECKQILLW